MKNLILILAIIIFGCENKSTNIKVEKSKINENQIESKYKKLLSKFETINVDTFYVYSTYNYDNFKGKRIEKSEAKLFPNEILEENFSLDEIDIFACFKFSIDSTKIGLIARTPSMYSPTSIKLFVYDKISDSLISYIEIAEIWGDAGESMEKKSWLFLRSNKIKILTEKIEKSDHRAYAEDENDTIIEIWKTLYQIDFTKTKFDTTNMNEKYLRKKYFEILKKVSY